MTPPSAPPPHREASYSVSARKKPLALPIGLLLAGYYPGLTLDGVFGFVAATPLNGGRGYRTPELSEADIAYLRDQQIALKLPLSNPFVDRDAYRASWELLARYEDPANVVVITADRLARWIRRDFPRYQREASAIKNITTPARLARALTLYHSVVLPASANDDLAFLESLAEKSRIRLFANAGCAYRCPAKVCYSAFGRSNRNQPITQAQTCSQQFTDHRSQFTHFDTKLFEEMGFHRFKLVRQVGTTGA